MKINAFEDIIAWQKAKELSILIYKVFGSSRDFGFKDQIQRATVSIMNNIAEGFERHSDNELRQGLYIAKGSCAEVRSMLYLAYELAMITESQFEMIKQLNIETSRILSGLIKSLRVGRD
jgi:four helix bundle protein